MQLTSYGTVVAICNAFRPIRKNGQVSVPTQKRHLKHTDYIK
jgi:hypothetical protein